MLLKSLSVFKNTSFKHPKFLIQITPQLSPSLLHQQLYSFSQNPMHDLNSSQQQQTQPSQQSQQVNDGSNLKEENKNQDEQDQSQKKEEKSKKPSFMKIVAIVSSIAVGLVFGTIYVLIKNKEYNYIEHHYDEAQAFISGKDRNQDFAKALISLKISGERDSLRALKQLSDIYLNGKWNIAKDQQEAVKYLKQGARLREPWCMMQLGMLYKDGLYLEKNEKLALEWFNRSQRVFPNVLDPEIAEMVYQAGLMYLEGRGTEKNSEMAVEKFYLVSTANRHAEAQYMMGLMSITGDGTTKDKKNGTWWIAKAAYNGSKRAQEFMDEAQGIAKEQGQEESNKEVEIVDIEKRNEINQENMRKHLASLSQETEQQRNKEKQEEISVIDIKKEKLA